MTTLLQLDVRSQRDLLVSRLRTRQIAKLLGFDETDQAKMACAVFELLWKDRQEVGELIVTFEVRDSIFYLHSEPSAQTKPAAESSKKLQIAKPLPRGPQALSEEDWAWVVYQIERLPVRLFDEVRRLNTELLQFFLGHGEGQTQSTGPAHTAQTGRAA